MEREWDYGRWAREKEVEIVPERKRERGGEERGREWLKLEHQSAGRETLGSRGKGGGGFWFRNGERRKRN